MNVERIESVVINNESFESFGEGAVLPRLFLLSFPTTLPPLYGTIYVLVIVVRLHVLEQVRKRIGFPLIGRIAVGIDVIRILILLPRSGTNVRLVVL